MADYQTIELGSTALRSFTMLARADGSPITSGTVNWYLLALSGSHAGKWWSIADADWDVTEPEGANPMTHKADGHWTVDPVSGGSPFAGSSDQYLEYAKESGDLHIPVKNNLVASPTPIADGSRRVQVQVGTTAGKISATSGIVDTNLKQILGTLLTESVAGYLAAAFKKLFDVAVPVFTSGSVNQTGDNFPRIGAAGAGLTALGDARIANLDTTISSRTKPADTQARVTLVDTVTTLTGHTPQTVDGATASTRILLALPAFAPDVAGGLITNNATERVIFVSATGSSNSNSGLDPSLPKQTALAAYSAARDGDAICVMGQVDTGNGLISAKKIHWRGYRDSTAKLTSSVDTPLTLSGGGASGSTIKNLNLENTSSSFVTIGTSAALAIAYGGSTFPANIDIENVVATCTGTASHGIYLFYARGIRLSRVVATGYARGMSIYDSTVKSEFGEYTGGESGVYMDCEIAGGRPTDTPGVRYTASSWTSTHERVYGINYTATPIAGSWAGVQAILYECHDNIARHSVKLIQPRFTAIATDAAFPRAVSVVYSGLADLGGAGPSDDSINNADFVIEGGTVDFLVNDGLGDTFSFRAVDAQTPSQASTFQVKSCFHDESLNDGNVFVDNTVATAAAASAASADGKGTTLLTRADVATSTRLASGSYTAPPSAAANAAALLAATNGPASVSTQLQHLDGDVSDAGGGGTPAQVDNSDIVQTRVFKLSRRSDGVLTANGTLRMKVGEKYPVWIDTTPFAGGRNLANVTDAASSDDAGLTLVSSGMFGAYVVLWLEAKTAGSYTVLATACPRSGDKIICELAVTVAEVS